MDTEVLIPISFFAAVAWIVYIVVEAYRRRQQVRLAAEFHGKLLERIGSAREFGEFLNTPGGTRFLDSLTIEREGGPHVRILRAVQSGLVLLALGLGLFLYVGSRSLPERAGDGIHLFGTVAVSLGVGLLMSAGASYGLSRRLGLIDDETTGRPHSAHSA